LLINCVNSICDWRRHAGCRVLSGLPSAFSEHFPYSITQGNHSRPSVHGAMILYSVQLVVKQALTRGRLSPASHSTCCWQHSLMQHMFSSACCKRNVRLATSLLTSCLPPKRCSRGWHCCLLSLHGGLGLLNMSSLTSFGCCAIMYGITMGNRQLWPALCLLACLLMGARSTWP